MTKEKSKGINALIICLCIFGGITLAYLGLVAAALVFHGIAQSKEVQATATTETRMLPKDLVNSDAVAYEVRCTNEGPFDWDSDYWQKSTYILHYNYELEIITKYVKSGEKKTTTKVTYSDFYEIKSLIENYQKKKKIYDKTLDYSKTYDGSIYGFTAYEPDGKKTYLYGGYIYGCEELESIAKILAEYDKAAKSS